VALPNLAANLSLLFSECDFLDRFEAAGRAGFRGVECQFPYAWPSEQLAERLARHGLGLILHNLPAGDWASGERGIAALPHRTEEFRQGVAQAIEYAKALGCRRLNCLAGIAPFGSDSETLRRTFIENLRYACSRLGSSGLQLLIEPVNTRDIPGFFLNSTRQAIELIEAVGAPNLALQYDVYHMTMMNEDVARTIESNLARIGHIQIADCPGRHEPGTGAIDFPALFELLERIGYRQWIGCEYVPAASTAASFSWARGFL
jgi:hydroxypyruvate isomerase